MHVNKKEGWLRSENSDNAFFSSKLCIIFNCDYNHIHTVLNINIFLDP